MTIYKKIRNEKGTLKIFYDEEPQSPREWDNLGKMICFHRRYSLGDKHDYRSDDYDGWDEFEKAIKRDYRRNKDEVAIMLPLYLYDHSGITISTEPFSCPWDSGQVGFIVVSKKDIRKEYNRKKVTKDLIEKAEKVLLGEVEIYDNYLCGEVYGFTLEDVEGNEIDSCWGFYGYDGLKDIAESIPEEYKSLSEQLLK